LQIERVQRMEMMKHQNKEIKNPPKKQIKSVEFDLFGQFMSNDYRTVSNTVEVWESIPKYFFTPRQVEKLRTYKGHADPYKWEYQYNETAYKVKIQPALIEQKDGSYKAYFPSITEELVEEAIKKIFASQHYGIHDPTSSESWVKFTLKMILKELKARNRSRSITEIKRAIEVMSSSVITIYQDDKEIWKGSILQDLITVGRKEYQADADAHHIARLPLFISHAINKLEYRQFNYQRLMECDEQLSRWIYKKLINRFTQASPMTNYHFLFSELKTSGLLQQARERDNRKKVSSALNELIENNVIKNFQVIERKEVRKIVDVKYTIIPSIEFVSEQKAANKRSTINETKAIQLTSSV